MKFPTTLKIETQDPKLAIAFYVFLNDKFLILMWGRHFRVTGWHKSELRSGIYESGPLFSIEIREVLMVEPDRMEPCFEIVNNGLNYLVRPVASSFGPATEY